MRTIDMQRSLLFLLALVFTSNPSCAQSASIGDVGIQGFFSIGSAPTRVRVQLSNPGPQPVILNITVSVSEKDAHLGRIDRFASSVSLQANESRTIDLPIPLFAGRPVLALDVSTSDGRGIAHQTQILQRPEANALVLLLCAEEKTCNEIVGTINASGNDEQKTRKTKAYTFLVLKDIPEEWWIYGPAHSVILARPASGLSARQREALEGYCRLRGQVTVIDDQVGPGFLDIYRAGARGVRTNVGTGALFHFPDAPELAAFLDRSVGDLQDGDEAKIFRQLGRFNAFRNANDSLPLVTTFSFPTLRWLTVWLVVYIVVVGVLNFFILTRLNRRELAWITVPAIALVFALMLYFMSAAKRPKNVGVDEIATYTMDNQSRQAAAFYEVRISSPHRQDLSVFVPGDAIWNGADQVGKSDANFSMFDRRATNFTDGWTVRFLPERTFEIPLQQWSYQDLNFSGIVTLPGSLGKPAPGQLKNETGLTFQEAVFLADGQVFDLGEIAAGATFASHRGAGEDVESVRKKWFEEMQRRDARIETSSREDLKRLLAIQSSSAPYPFFAGLAEAPVLGANVAGQNFIHRQYIIVVVGMRSTP